MTKPFATFYDAASDTAAARERALTVLGFVRQHHKNAESILELGTGNGNVLSNIPRKYNLHGLDIEKDFVELTRQKVPHAHLSVSSMHNFEMKVKVDVVFSIYDSINFLENFQQWQQTIATVHRHLNENGLFIFDMYTPLMLEKYKDARASFSSEPFGYSTDQGIVEGNSLTWDVKLFERIGENLYELHQYYFKERIYPVGKVESALIRHFHILEKVDGDSKEKPSKNTTRLLYAARRA